MGAQILRMAFGLRLAVTALCLAAACADPVVMLDAGLARGGQQGLRKALDQAATQVAAKAVKGVKEEASRKATSTSTAAVAKALTLMNKKRSSEKVKKRIKRSALTTKDQLRLRLIGCKNKLSSGMCQRKMSLCRNKRFGSIVQKQCPKTCNVCPHTTHARPRSRKFAVTCTPKRIVKTLASALMKASSSLSANKGANKARLHSLSSPWVAGRQRKGQWLQISLPREMTITAVETRGRFNANQWVTYYKLMHKVKHWRWYGGAKWLRGNWDREHSKKHVIRPFKAKVLRFYPQKWHHKIAMRVEVYGCVEKTKKSLKPRKKLPAYSSGH